MTESPLFLCYGKFRPKMLGNSPVSLNQYQISVRILHLAPLMQCLAPPGVVLQADIGPQPVPDISMVYYLGVALFGQLPENTQQSPLVCSNSTFFCTLQNTPPSSRLTNKNQASMCNLLRVACRVYRANTAEIRAAVLAPSAALGELPGLSFGPA
jgi:hypothetical protein